MYHQRMAMWYVKMEDAPGVYETLPEKYKNFPCMDYGDRLILPGLVDLHVHAPQYAFRGIGMDLELIDWLNTHTFPESKKIQGVDQIMQKGRTGFLVRISYKVLLRELYLEPLIQKLRYG